jgi:hypothetical protein
VADRPVATFAAPEPEPGLDALAQIELVENAALSPEGQSAMLHVLEEPERGEQRDRVRPVPLDAPGLALAPKSIERGLEVRRAFEHAGADSTVAEQLLEEFVAGEVPIILELQKVEGALVGLLGRTVTDPALVLKVAEVLKETVALSGAVRRRTEGTLAAVAGLRAQRAFIAAHRPAKAVRLGQ